MPNPKKMKRDKKKKTSVAAVKICPYCRPFCASWTGPYVRDRTIICDSKCTFGNPGHAIQHYCHIEQWERDNSHYQARLKIEKEEPARVVVDGGCSIEQRVALLSSLYKLSKRSNEHRVLADPKFLKGAFEDLLVDKSSKTVNICVLYSCCKVRVECRVLAKGLGVEYLEDMLGPLQVFQHDDEWKLSMADSDEDEEEVLKFNPYDRPYAVENVGGGYQNSKHFILTQDQWEKARSDVGCCFLHDLYMSVFTYKNIDSVDVKNDIQMQVES